MQIAKLLLPISTSPPGNSPFHLRLFASNLTRRVLHSVSQDNEMKELVEYIDSLKNYEKWGVPKGAGTDSDDGFDLGRMRRLMGRLGDPQSKLKVIHIAGTKGKGSTAAFLSNMLRAQGYKVGSYTSPHIRTIRERISVEKLGEPVPAVTLNGLFSRIKGTLDESVQLENGCLSHFEVFTAIAFALFADEKVDIAVIEAGLGGARDATNIISNSELIASIITNIGEEHLDALGGSLQSIAMAKAGIIKHRRPVVLGGPFLPHIEQILREKALSTSSPVVLASGSGNRSVMKNITENTARPSQYCDLLLQFDQDLNLSIELLDVRLSMLGVHQLQNAATATFAVLYMRSLGWEVSDASIRAGLEQTYLLGRSQFLKAEEATALGLPGSTILLDGAHTKESARTLVDMVKTLFPCANLALVVAMASDKDHTGFAKEFLSGIRLELVVSTEANIAGGAARTTSSSSLRDCWVEAAEELNINILHLHDPMNEHGNLSLNQIDNELDDRTVVTACKSLDTSLQLANRILERRRRTRGGKKGILLVTGSLHVVSAVLSSIR